MTVKGSSPAVFTANAGTWPNGNTNANIVPVVVNSQVFVASYKQLAIWGLPAAPMTPPQPTVTGTPSLLTTGIPTILTIPFPPNIGTLPSQPTTTIGTGLIPPVTTIRRRRQSQQFRGSHDLLSDSPHCACRPAGKRRRRVGSDIYASAATARHDPNRNRSQADRQHRGRALTVDATQALTQHYSIPLKDGDPVRIVGTLRSGILYANAIGHAKQDLVH